jgi:AraC-like DNA-binding protein/CheY-like chemotaxis protein
MNTAKILWVDFRFFQDQVSAYHCLNGHWAVSHINKTERLDLEIHKTTPALLCFEYDYPDKSGLLALQQTRHLFPSTSVIMLTEQHSEALSIWALRLRVWDYFIKPIQPKELVTSATTILTQRALSKNKTLQTPRQHFNFLYNPIPPKLKSRSSKGEKTNPAQTFVENHYHEKIYEAVVAELCGMNSSAFSRSFKKEHKTNFRDYLINFRIHKARELLQEPNAMVTDIAYTVGFNDPSYFTRTFQRIVGMSPSCYHEAHKIR